MADAPTDPTSAPLEQWDVQLLLAQARGRGISEEARARIVTEMYRRTFHTACGRFVLMHFSQSCGVGRKVGGRQGHELSYAAGMHDAAIDLANEAGFDDAALIAASILNQDLIEEPDDERRDSPGTVPGPDDDF